MLTTSTSEGYSLLFKLLCDPGDEVLVPRPSYPLFDHLARLDGVVAKPYDLDYQGVWSIDLDSVERAMGVLMVITGIGFLTGAVSGVSIWLLETFPALQNFG